MTPAEELRRAAALMQERAEAVARGPCQWEAMGEKRYPQRVTNPAAILIAETYVDPAAVPAEAIYIASMHPLIGLALADLLEMSAVTYDELARSAYGEAGVAFVSGDDGSGDPDPGLKIARIYLEGDPVNADV